MASASRRAWTAFVLTAIAALFCFLLLYRAQRAGAPSHDVRLPGGIPATFYDPPSGVAAPPPTVVLAHGYSGDRVTVSSLARRITAAGYAVLAFDFDGHGGNRNPADQDMTEEVSAAVDWVEIEHLDSNGIAVMGHSMGAHAVLRFAGRDARADAVLAIGSGISDRDGAHRPRNLLLLVAERDPSSIHVASQRLASEVAGTEVDLNRTFGDVRRGDGVRLVEMEGTNHITVLWSSGVAKESVKWLDQTWGVERAPLSGREDPRLPPFVGYLLCALVLVAAMGFLLGRRLRSRSRKRVVPGGAALMLIGTASAFALPMSALLPKMSFLPSGFGEVVASLVAGAGLLFISRVVLARGIGPTSLRAWAAEPILGAEARAKTAGGAGAGIALTGLLFSPVGYVFHRIMPTPERALLIVVMFVLLAPFFVIFHQLLRVGRWTTATIRSIAGHALLSLVLVAGVAVGALPSVVLLAVPTLGCAFLVVEVFGLGEYLGGSEGRLVGLYEAALLAGLAGATLPIGY